jgi:hypothetical protein
MKRIIGGKTYNTETATRVAEVDYWGGDNFDELYQTRFGAYFRYSGDEDQAALVPLTPSEAQEWMERGGEIDLIEKHFGIQPEAGSSESRVTLRIPDTLKSRIEALATGNGQSLNAWIMRCLEHCIADQTEKP